MSKIPAVAFRACRAGAC